MKSAHALFSEGLEQLRKAFSKERYDKVVEACKKISTIEGKVSCIQKALDLVKESAMGNGISLSDGRKLELFVESDKDFTNKFETLFGTTETRPRYVPKNNGAEDNGSFAPSKESAANNNIYLTESYQATLDGLVKRGQITEAQRRQLEGKTVDESKYNQLTEAQRREFNFAKTIGLSESDCFKLVAITKGYGNEYTESQTQRQQRGRF